MAGRQPRSDASFAAYPAAVSTADPQVAFFDAVRAAFERIAAAGAGAQRSYRVAGRHVTLRFADRTLVAAITPALAHLETADPGEASLTVGLWSGAPGGVALPLPPWAIGDYYGNGEIRGYDGRIRAAFDIPLGMLTLFDRERRLGLFWLRDASHVPITIVGTPLRGLFQWWAGDDGRQLVHAAAVGTPQGGVLLAGKSGCGKSSTAMLALQNGLQCAGDDFVLVEADSPSGPWVHGLYSSAKLDPLALARRFSELASRTHGRGRAEHEKAILFLHDQWPARVSAGFPVVAIAVPHVANRTETSISPTSAAFALRAMLPSIFPLPGARQSAFDRLAALARQVRTYALDLGTEPAGILQALHQMIAGEASCR